jgi:hypothetical protein
MMWFPILSGVRRHDLRYGSWSCGPRPIPTALGIPIQRTIAGMDPDLPVSDVLTMQQVLGKSIGQLP